MEEAKKCVRAAIIGCGAIYTMHADALAVIPDAEIVGFADIDLPRAQAAVEKYGGIAYVDYQEMLAKEQPDYKAQKKLLHAQIAARAEELLTQVGLKEKMDLYPHQLSGGQQQRVAIARALALQPDILCFDEPTSALDPELTGEVLKVIRSLSEQHMTMIIVTHEMAFARDVADRVIFMDGGVIVEQGPAHDVIENPQAERTRQFLARYRENQ